MARQFKRALVVVHLYLGLLLCVLFAIWFVSGVAMVYYRTPVLDGVQRAAFDPPFPGKVQFSGPSAVTELAAGWSQVERLTAATFAGRPLYRWRLNDGRWRSGWADDGSFASFDPASLAPAAADWFGADAPFRYSGAFDEHTQWTFFTAVRGHLPLHRFSVGDSLLRRDVYFSSQTGEPLISTTPATRLLYVLGPGLHYASFHPVRNRDQLWRDLVNWTSGAGVVLAASGIVIGLWRIRWKALGTPRRKIPFTRPWMRWHHLIGLVVAIPIFTFVLSGLFSMNPGGMFPGMAVAEPLVAAHQGARPPISSLPGADAGRASLVFSPRRVDYLQRNGTFHLLAHADGQKRQRVSLEQGAWRAEPPYSKAALVDHVDRIYAGSVLSAQWLDHYDNHYYARKDRYRPLPVLRLVLDAPRGTWLYLDPISGELLRQTDPGSRARRWLYNGLHSLDPQFLLDRPRLWTFLIWALSFGGLAASITGIVLSWNWLRRRISRYASHGSERSGLFRGIRS